MLAIDRFSIGVLELGRYEGNNAVTSDLLVKEDALEFTSYVTEFSWSHSVNSPYSQATVSILIPLRELITLGFGSYDEERKSVDLHASGQLVITETAYNDSGARTGFRRRFYGPITALNMGFKVDKAQGLRQTVPITFTASTWLMPLMRGFIVSGKDDLDIGTAVIPYKKWQKIAEGVFSSAGEQGLTSALNTAWGTLCEDVVNVFVSVVSGNEYYTFRKRQGENNQQDSADVYGRNLSQLQPPPIAGTLWGVLQNTFQASPLIELFPSIAHWASDDDDDLSTFALVYRLRPLSPRIAKHHVKHLKGSGLEGQKMDAEIPFVPTSDVPPPLEAHHVISYDLSYGDARNNYIEVTSPYTGSTLLAGISCDPLYHKGDIEAYGLFRVSVPYPYIRSSNDSDAKIRDEMNDLTKYASLLYSFDHKYASGRVVTKYMEDSTLSHGDWVRWRSRGPERDFYVGYITKMAHSFKVDERGVLEGVSTYNVERTQAEFIPRGGVQMSDPE